MPTSPPASPTAMLRTWPCLLAALGAVLFLRATGIDTRTGTGIATRIGTGVGMAADSLAAEPNASPPQHYAQYQQAFIAYQNQDFAQAERHWRALAAHADADAQYALGVMQLRLEATQPSAANAVAWFQQAAARGHPSAMFNLGIAYWQGNGVSTDKPQALYWWQRAATGGDSSAQFNLGLAYYLGHPHPADPHLAAHWLRLAAEQNHPQARRLCLVVGC